VSGAAPFSVKSDRMSAGCETCLQKRQRDLTTPTLIRTSTWQNILSRAFRATRQTSVISFLAQPVLLAAEPLFRRGGLH
jgi:hypothetical protein